MSPKKGKLEEGRAWARSQKVWARIADKPIMGKTSENAGLEPSSATAQKAGTIHNRRTPRRLFERPVGILVKGEFLVLRARQLSEGGLLVETPNGDQSLLSHLAVGSLLTVTLLLPTGAGLVLRGQTIYHTDPVGGAAGPNAVGVKFDDILLHQRRLIRNYVSSKPVGE